MSEETYYTLLNVKGTASPSEIKAAYRDLIKQVHPDTIATLAPYLRRIAEDKAKEITEAYGVLSNSSKRRDYDKQLVAYRRQNTPASPPPTTPPPTPHATSQAPSDAYCKRCGAPLNGRGFCPKCKKFTAASATPPLMRWSREHPAIALAILVLLVWVVVTALPNNDTTLQPTHAGTTTSIAPTSPNTIASKKPHAAAPKSRRSVSGTYVGTVYNQAANLSSAFVVVMNQDKAGILDGCVEVKPPLYGSGALHGTINGSHVDFSVADITFNGNSSKNAMDGSYVVSRQDGQQLGEFRLTKQIEPSRSYGCADGAVIEFEISAAPS